MHRVAASLVDAERQLGLDSILCQPFDAATFAVAQDADIHVCHTHVPLEFQYGGKPLVWVSHGTPETVFMSAVNDGSHGSYGHSDAWMIAQYRLKTAAAIVTFWERHAALWQSMCDRHTKVHCLPLGLDLDFWKPFPSRGKYAGAPSLFTAENPHIIKWPLDLFLALPFVVSHPQLHNLTLHCSYMVRDQHRWFFPLVNANGVSFHSHLTPNVYGNEDLRNVFNSIDFYIGLVRYGDFNRICLEAKACGTKVISYEGNPYADFWITEGDQRRIAAQLIDILTGKTPPRETKPVVSIAETAKGMLEIYKGIG